MFCSRRIQASVEAMMKKVEAMEDGGDLDGLIVGEIDKLKRLLYQEALARREARAAEKAAFSPSGMSEVLEGEDAKGRASPAQDSDDHGPGRV